MFCSSHFSFLVFGHFWRWSYENTKILHNLCLNFDRQDGQDGKKRKESHATKVTKIPKTKRRKYGMNETLVYEVLVGLKLGKSYLLFRWQGCFPFKSQCFHGHWRNCKGRFDISSGKFEKNPLQCLHHWISFFCKWSIFAIFMDEKNCQTLVFNDILVVKILPTLPAT